MAGERAREGMGSSSEERKVGEAAARDPHIYAEIASLTHRKCN